MADRCYKSKCSLCLLFNDSGEKNIYLHHNGKKLDQQMWLFRLDTLSRNIIISTSPYFILFFWNTLFLLKQTQQFILILLVTESGSKSQCGDCEVLGGAFASPSCAAIGFASL